MGCGWLRAIESCRARSAFSRASSLSGNLGLWATSATSPTNSAPNSESTSPPIVVRFSPTAMSSEPPIRAASSAICDAERVAVPSVRRSPVRSASQTSLAFSSTLPVRTARLIDTLGTVPYCTSVTPMPLSSVKVFGVGTEKPLGVPGAGGDCLSARSGAAAASRRIGRAVRVFMACLLRSALVVGRGLALGLDDEDRAIGGPQVLLRHLLHLLRSDLGELGFEAVDLGGIVVEERERREQVRLSESAELLHLVVEARAHLHHGPIQRGLVDRRLLHLVDLAVEDRQDLVHRLVFVVNHRDVPERGPVDVEHVAEAGVDASLDLAGESALLDECLIEPAVLALDEDLIEQSHRVVVGSVLLRRVIADRERGARRDGIGFGGALLLLLPGLGDVGLRRERRGRDPVEVFLDP